jgi:hypothetical protein
MGSLVTLAALLNAVASADGGSSSSITEASPAADLLAGSASCTSRATPAHPEQLLHGVQPFIYRPVW